MPDKDWDGTERRVLTKEEVASVLDAEKLSSDRYRRHVIKNTLLAVVAGVIVAIPVSLIVGHDIKRSAHANSAANCQSQAAGRPVGNARNFGSIEILPTADDAFALFPKHFQEVEIARINRDLARLHRRHLIPADYPQKIMKFGDLVKFEKYLPLINCGLQVK